MEGGEAAVQKTNVLYCNFHVFHVFSCFLGAGWVRVGIFKQKKRGERSRVIANFFLVYVFASHGGCIARVRTVDCVQILFLVPFWVLQYISGVMLGPRAGPVGAPEYRLSHIFCYFWSPKCAHYPS